MRIQDYEPPKLTLGVVGLVAIIIPILLGYFLVSGLGTSSSYQFPGLPGSTTTTTSSGAGSTVAVSIPSGASNPANPPGYAPDTITVVVGVNASVKWSNDDSAPHTVTSTSVPAGAASFDSGNMNAGDAFTYNFTTPGTYQYHCSYHSWMTGTVVVKAGTGSSGIKVSIPVGAGAPSGAPGYAPDKITVVVGVNNTVTWTNDDGQTHHTVTSSSTPSGAASFNSGDMAGGASFSYTFTVPGTYQYLCSYHSWMTGTVVVVAGSGSASTSSSSSSSASSTTSSSSSAAQANGLAVSIPSGAGLPSGAPGYAPDKITLVIGVNNTVTWTNDDSSHHTVTSSSVPAGANTFDSGDMAPGAVFSWTFTVPGTYQYTCSYHSWMSGTITVVQGP